MAYQSLYRRYRPQKFAEIKGQSHVVAALQNAVVKDEVGHAYLLHGPRGTGKTTSARVLAKALNCENRAADGEPCGECESCVAIEQGRSFDLHELDAASNNRVDDMRDLLGKVNLGTPGRAKVYILDEVHMLTAGAENALLKTLEEPPPHVTWVLATTEPHKVVPTIRSRCQVFELNLLGAEEMEAHVRWVVEDAGLEVDDAAIDHVIEAGGGSVRDTLSALDGVVAAGGVVEVDTSTAILLNALAEHDVAAALAAVVDSTGRGADPRRIGENAVSGLRDAFLVAMGAPPPTLAAGARRRAEELASNFSPAGMTRALEIIGTTLVEMRQAPDPRVFLEVALVRICRVASDQSIEALTERIEQLERRLDGGGTVAPRAAAVESPPVVAAPDSPEQTRSPEVPTSPPSVPTAPPVPAEAAQDSAAAASSSDTRSDRGDGPAARARRAMGRPQSVQRPEPASTPAPPAPPPVVPPPAPAPPVEVAPEFAPTTPGQVVEMAVTTLDMSKDHVIARANEILGPKQSGVPRSPADLLKLWQQLQRESASPTTARPPAVPAPPPAVPAPTPTPPPAVPAPPPAAEEPPPDRRASAPTEPDPIDEVDLTDLVDAPDHEDQLLEQLSQAFPGAELLPTEQDDQND